jgi:hypothetical protein
LSHATRHMPAVPKLLSEGWSPSKRLDPFP